MKHPVSCDLRFGVICGLYYSIRKEKLPHQLDLLDLWMPSLAVEEQTFPDTGKHSASYDYSRKIILASRWKNRLYTGEGRQIPQLIGRLTGLAKGNREKERANAEDMQRRMTETLINDADAMERLVKSCREKIQALSDEEYSELWECLAEWILACARKREEEQQDWMNEAFPMYPETFDGVLYNAAFLLFHEGEECLAFAVQWLLLGGLLRNECGRLLRAFDAWFQPYHREAGETPSLLDRLDYIYHPEDYESVYNGDDLDRRFPDVTWYCDQCDDNLNLQEGFDDTLPVWQCRKCGYLNQLEIGQVYASKEAYEHGEGPVDGEDFEAAVAERRALLEKQNRE